MAAPTTIPDLVLENFGNSIYFLSELFQMDPTAENLFPFIKILAALRALPLEAMDDIAKPILLGQFKALRIDPTTERGRKFAEKFVDLLALGIQDATNMIMQSMDNQAKNVAALRKGRPGLIR